MQYSNEGMESLHTLPLAVLPFQTKALASVKLIKNTQLRSVIELFSGEQTGSGQIEISDIGSRSSEGARFATAAAAQFYVLLQ